MLKIDRSFSRGDEDRGIKRRPNNSDTKSDTIDNQPKEKSQLNAE